MRKIKFRGKVYMSDIWSYGYLVDDFVIKDINEGVTLMVDAKTIGQFTGLKDKNGKEIYEGDILKILSIFGDESICTCKWIDSLGCYKLVEAALPFGDFFGLTQTESGNIEVIGNIHDNPELLEGKE